MVVYVLYTSRPLVGEIGRQSRIGNMRRCALNNVNKLEHMKTEFDVAARSHLMFGSSCALLHCTVQVPRSPTTTAQPTGMTVKLVMHCIQFLYLRRPGRIARMNHQRQIGRVVNCQLRSGCLHVHGDCEHIYEMLQIVRKQFVLIVCY